ncbi:hypothetical protein HYX11_04635 [Candidatus Woesearchaeota archaeon]|nr:hypothetical protein [Candidatus Woesearchaeota archaeon]
MSKKQPLTDIISALEQHCRDTVVKLEEYYHGYHELKDRNFQLTAEKEKLMIKISELEKKTKQYKKTNLIVGGTSLAIIIFLVAYYFNKDNTSGQIRYEDITQNCRPLKGSEYNYLCKEGQLCDTFKVCFPHGEKKQAYLSRCIVHQNTEVCNYLPIEKNKW